jgi:hypothetical protein
MRRSLSAVFPAVAALLRAPLTVSAAPPNRLSGPSAPPIAGDQSQIMVLTVIGAILVALIGAVFMLLAARDRHHHAAPEAGDAGQRTTGRTRADEAEDAAVVLARAAEQALAERAVRRARIRRADDPVPGTAGFRLDAPSPSVMERTPARGSPGAEPGRD